MEKQWYTISVYSENQVGLLNRISGIFLKRHINIESLNVSKSEIEGISKFTIVVYTAEETTRRIVAQIEKQIDVVKAFYHTDDETIYQESAIFKIASHLLFDERQIQNIIKDQHAQIVTVSRDFFVLAKTGRRHEIDEMYQALVPYGILQFVRSGRISVSKASMPISSMLADFNNV
ncbi:acetolactate synthase small subunit [Robiginitalea sp.]|nr:acetolactate synthase small subunit [Robiginitalea sp.]